MILSESYVILSTVTVRVSEKLLVKSVALTLVTPDGPILLIIPSPRESRPTVAFTIPSGGSGVHEVFRYLDKISYPVT